MTAIPLDYAHDISGRETHRLTALYPQPDFVKSAAADRLAGDGLPRHLYADQKSKLYPCHTAPATWMSALFFADKAAQFDEKTAADIQSKIHQAAEYFGISGLVAELETKMAASQTNDLSSLPDADFAIVWSAANANKERHWPLRNATEVKFAASHFKQYRDQFCFDDRHVIATKILEKASQYGADVSEADGSLELAAGYGACAAKVASDMLKDRVRLTQRQHGQLASELFKLAELIDQNPEKAREVGTRLKLASAVDTFDRDTHLDRLYSAGGLPRPEEVLFAVTEKVARDFMNQNVETTTGNVYDLTDLEKLAVEDVRDWMGDDFADAVSAGGVYMDRDKLAAIVPTLDRGMAATFDRLVQEKNAAAVVKQAAAEDTLLPLSLLHELARQ